MKKIKHIISFFVFSTLLLCLTQGCKKYPEDDVRYWFKKPEKRLPGTWQLTKYYVNNADSTAFLYKQYIGHCTSSGSPCYQYGILDYTFVKNDDPNGYWFTSIQGIDDPMSIKLISDKNYISILYGGEPYNSFPIYNPFIVYNSDWKIRELTNINLKITNTINNINYRIEFVKQ